MPTTTAAVCRNEGGPFEIERLTIDDPRDDEVLVRIVGSGVCHTDLICRDQWIPVPFPVVLGHEGSGIVEAVGAAVTKVAPGDRVVMTYHACGRCRSCITGYPTYCAELAAYNFGSTRQDGSTALRDGAGDLVHSHFFGQSSWSELALGNEANVVKVETDLPLEMLGPLGCGIQTGAGGVFNSLAPRAGSSIAVFGVGSVGLSAVMAANAAGCTRIIAIDLKPGRLELAQSLGATDVVNGSQVDDVVAAVKELSGGGVDYSIETTASPQVLRSAVESLAILGTCGIIGAAAFGTEVSLDMNDLMIGGKSVRGIIEGDSVPDLFIPQLITLIEQGKFPLERLVKEYPLAEVNTASADSEAGVTVKAVLVP
jgi:aryl-alcohol dehydrogenase